MTTAVARQIHACLSAVGSRREQLIETLLSTPAETLDCMLRFSGPFPDNETGRDFWETTLPNLLGELVTRDPRILLDRNPHELIRTNALLVLGVALSQRRAAFTPLILAGLRAPSLFDRLTVIHAIASRKRLRTPQARQELQRLLTLKSIASDAYSRTCIENALAKFL